MRPSLLTIALAMCAVLGKDGMAQDHGIREVLAELHRSGSTQLNFRADVRPLDDLDGDGVPEILASLRAQQSVLMLDGSSGTSLATFPTAGSNPRSILCEDYDGDGLREWAVIDVGLGMAPKIRVMGMGWSGGTLIQIPGIGWAGGVQQILLPPAESQVAAVELDSDRDGDGFRELFIVSAMNSAQDLHVRYISPMTGAIVQEFTFTLAFHPHYLGAAALDDIDQDGVRDFAIGNTLESHLGIPQAGSVRVHSGATGAPLYELFGADEYDRLGVRVVRAPDLDGDGIGDLLCLSSDGDYLVAASPARGVELYRQDTNTFLAAYSLWPVAWAEDRDGDGVRDLLEGDSLRSGRDGRILANLNRAPWTGDHRAHALTIDLDGDGFRELISGLSAHAPPNPHAVLVQSVRPGIRAAAVTLSLQNLQPVSFELYFPDAVRGQHYQVLASTAPVGASVVAGLETPLGASQLLQHMVQRPPLGVFPGCAGIVPASGPTSATLTVGGPAALQALGMTIRFAVVTGQGGGATWSSFSVPVTIVP